MCCTDFVTRDSGFNAVTSKRHIDLSVYSGSAGAAADQVAAGSGRQLHCGHNQAYPETRHRKLHVYLRRTTHM